jgi:regulator of sirC expression with transglutaminase-like and TPR domain
VIEAASEWVGRASGSERRDRRQRVALLLDLLRDDSPVVLKEVRVALRAAGATALPALRRAARGDDIVGRTRARQLLLEHARERAWRRVCGIALRRPFDLELGLLLLGAYQSPGIDLRHARAALDVLGSGLRERLEGQGPGAERALLIGHYLGTELGYRGDRKDYHHPDNVNLARCLERKLGLPLTLAALYRSVARRAGLRVDVLPMPGHVLARVEEGRSRPILDPFDSGKPLSETDCRSYLTRNGIPWHREWLEPALPERIFMRQLANLQRTARERGWNREGRRLGRLHQVLEASLRPVAARAAGSAS